MIPHADLETLRNDPDLLRRIEHDARRARADCLAGLLRRLFARPAKPVIVRRAATA